MTQRRVILSDGTGYMNASAGYADEILWCYLPAGLDIVRIFADFTNPEKTARITFAYELEEVVYEGQTVFGGLMVNKDGTISVCMKKGA